MILGPVLCRFHGPAGFGSSSPAGTKDYIVRRQRMGDSVLCATPCDLTGGWWSDSPFCGHQFSQIEAHPLILFRLMLISSYLQISMTNWLWVGQTLRNAVSLINSQPCNVPSRHNRTTSLWRIAWIVKESPVPWRSMVKSMAMGPTVVWISSWANSKRVTYAYTSL